MKTKSPKIAFLYSEIQAIENQKLRIKKYILNEKQALKTLDLDIQEIREEIKTHNNKAKLKKLALIHH